MMACGPLVNVFSRSWSLNSFFFLIQHLFQIDHFQDVLEKYVCLPVGKCHIIGQKYKDTDEPVTVHVHVCH